MKTILTLAGLALGLTFLPTAYAGDEASDQNSKRALVTYNTKSESVTAVCAKQCTMMKKEASVAVTRDEGDSKKDWGKTESSSQNSKQNKHL